MSTKQKGYHLSLLLLLSCCLPLLLYAQEREPLPLGFEEFQLGMGLEQVKNALLASGSFLYRGDPDVSLLDRENRSLLEVEGSGYFRSGQFQFSADDRLFVIVLVIDESLIDYFTLYTTFTGKYGDPDDLNPDRAVWENEVSRISLERPAVVRYIENKMFGDLIDAGEAQKSYERISREEFLSRF